MLPHNTRTLVNYIEDLSLASICPTIDVSYTSMIILFTIRRHANSHDTRNLKDGKLVGNILS